MEHERRAFLRVETDMAVACSPIEPDGERGPPFIVATVNLSAGGARLLLPSARDRTEAGRRYWLELRFHTPRFLVFTEAEVVRVEEDGFAVRFDELEQYTLQRVVRWVYAQDRRLFERRAQARIPVRARAVCRRIAPDGEAVEEFAAPTVDVALDAVRIRSDRLLAIGTAVDVALDFEDGLPPFTAHTVVAAVSELGDRFEYQLRLEAAGPAQQRMLIERALAAERRIGP